MASTIRYGVLTLLHTACGAGILAMPYAFKPFGLIPGFIMIAICGLCSLWGLILQARVTKYSKTDDNDDTANDRSVSFFSLTQIINPNLSVIFDLAIAIKCFGVGVSYMIVVGDLMPQILSHLIPESHSTSSLLLSRNFHITIMMLCIVSPLCFMKNLSSLRYASMVAISSVVYLCVLVVFHFLSPSQEIKDLKGELSYWLPNNEPSPLVTLPIFVFAYTCHHNMFSVINEQIDNSFHNIKKLAIIAMSLAFSLYIIIGGSGYYTFGDNIVGNIITLYPQSVSSTIGRMAIVFLVTLAFPLQCHPARASIHHIILYITMKINDAKEIKPSNPQQEPLALSANNQERAMLIRSERSDTLIEEESPLQPVTVPLEGKQFILITTSILICSYLLAISVSSLAHVLAIVGATGSTSISFILPGVFGYKLIGSEMLTTEQLPIKTRLFKYSGLLLSIWGVFIMITSLAASILLGASH
ncbi:amino acid transporter NDAI_0E04010 [Naumovozyma dairenensis CBS 421]|uniref:Amino acid transporter transmembrane domain-containing protein n=1 Tax=Naumovozyma dairenensis (strain ATCC 10597 / BCRC 20456 / CBS 421 / NBRC 0211 / NRRL Y-12639) TaxID=1071378 RepID=G0WBU8_NAUDC|nr:hypothetical protein NDAI_0E04010 [Naumovozyma dairenensis CBS 421]CCD25218.1 hypothetical protein NDAI_0E04010 [Naumovozyma dairenensis CBS 421]